MPSPTRYPRQGENLDFGRVVVFTDAVFAIAMTLLVVKVGVPEAAGDATDDPGALLDLLQDKVPLVVAFFIGCFGAGRPFVSPRLAVLLWFLAIPLGRLLDRRRPAGADRYLA